MSVFSMKRIIEDYDSEYLSVVKDYLRKRTRKLACLERRAKLAMKSRRCLSET